MIRNWIEKKLIEKLNKSKHEVIKLQWQKAELERKIEMAKKDKATSTH